MTRWIALALVGCKGGGGDETDPNLDFLDENNFEYKAEVAIESTDVAANTDFCGDWSAITTDLRGRPLAPGDVEQVALLEFDLTQAEVAAKVADNTLKQSDAATLWTWDNTNGESSVCASQFEIIGQVLDPTAPEPLDENPAQSWLMSLLKVSAGYNDVLSSVFVNPLESSSNTEITFTDTSSVLTITKLDIAGKPTLKTAAGHDAYFLDWGNVTTDVNGQAFDPLFGDVLAVARFDVADPAELDELFLRLDTEAAEYYTMPETESIFGKTEAELSKLTLADGTPFAGFTTDGVWVVAISCSTCTSPVPLLLGVVEVSPE